MSLARSDRSISGARERFEIKRKRTIRLLRSICHTRDPSNRQHNHRHNDRRRLTFRRDTWSHFYYSPCPSVNIYCRRVFPSVFAAYRTRYGCPAYFNFANCKPILHIWCPGIREFSSVLLRGRSCEFHAYMIGELVVSRWKKRTITNER